MTLQGTFSRLWGMALLVLLFSIFILNVNSFDIAHEMAKTPSLVDQYEDTANYNQNNLRRSHTNNLRVAPSSSNKVAIFKMFAALVSVIAISMLIVRCLRSIKSGGSKNSNRRLAGANDDQCQGAEGGELTDVEVEQESNRMTLQVLMELNNLDPDNGEHSSLFTTILDGQVELWRDAILNQAMQRMTEAQPDGMLSEEQRQMIRQGRMQILQGVIPNLLVRSNMVQVLLTTAALHGGLSDIATSMGVDLGNALTLLQRLNGTEPITLGDEDLLAAIRPSRDHLSLHAAGIVDSFDRVIRHLIIINNMAVPTSIRLNAAIHRIGLSDTELFKQISEDEDAAGATGQ